MRTRYKQIYLSEGILKVQSIDYNSLNEEQQACYYEVYAIVEHDITTIKFICDFKYQTLSNQN